jgi:low affinity Fe/Cu permease
MGNGNLSKWSDARQETHRASASRGSSRGRHSSLPFVSLTIIAAVVGLIAVGAALGFPTAWVTSFNISVSGVTLVMVFAIQHTQGREQAATQRKLDELLRALPNADESLMMLEEASPGVMLDVEEEQRDVRSTSPDTNPP